jgi:hypothetical protein
MSEKVALNEAGAGYGDWWLALSLERAARETAPSDRGRRWLLGGRQRAAMPAGFGKPFRPSNGQGTEVWCGGASGLRAWPTDGGPTGSWASHSGREGPRLRGRPHHLDDEEAPAPQRGHRVTSLPVRRSSVASHGSSATAGGQGRHGRWRPATARTVGRRRPRAELASQPWWRIRTKRAGRTWSRNRRRKAFASRVATRGALRWARSVQRKVTWPSWKETNRSLEMAMRWV